MGYVMPYSAAMALSDPDARMNRLMKYDFQLAHESEADKKTGRVGADPAAILGAAE